MKASTQTLVKKVILYQIIFLLVHFVYDWFPGEVTKVFSATNESVYQHMKVAFFSYLLLVLGEFILLRRSIPSVLRFSYARIAGAVILPLIMVVFFLSGPLFFIKIENIRVCEKVVIVQRNVSMEEANTSLKQTCPW